MNILVVNGSPRGPEGNTNVLVQAFLDGACEAGAESETIYLKDKNIKHCVGCYNCWFKTPGVCVHKDDMPELMMKIPKADIVIYAVPLYIYTVTGLMKDFMDRLLPLAQPFVDIVDGLSIHPPRFEDAGARRVVLISNSGFPEQAHFSGMKETFRNWVRGGNRTLSGMICCAGGALLQVPHVKDRVTRYTDAVKQAGRQIVENGCISKETQSILDEPLVLDQNLFAEQANAFFSSMGIERI